MSTVQTLVIGVYSSTRNACIYFYAQSQYMFVFDALVESIRHENNCITGPANVAKEKLKKLAKVSSTTKMSGYESQFKVIHFLTNFLVVWLVC